MQDMVVILENGRTIIFVADKKTVIKNAQRVANKFGSPVARILTTPLRKFPEEKVCGFLDKNMCLVMEDTCPFFNRIMSQCKSFTERE